MDERVVQTLHRGSLATRVAVDRRAGGGDAVPRRRGAAGKVLLGLSLAAIVAVAGFGAGTMAAGVPTSISPSGQGGTVGEPGRGPAAGVNETSWSPPERPHEMKGLFASFDENSNGLLDVAEAGAFYGWVEDHIEYRWDDETTAAADGFTVGDGRAGPDYQQTPEETLSERMGDCEDQNGVELAFYAHWKVPAYMAYVNALSNATYDHAVTLVKGGDSLDDFRARLGPVPYYEARGRTSIEDGFYFIVDHTFSSEFAKITGGIGEKKFVVDHVVSYHDLFGEPWAPILPSV